MTYQLVELEELTGRKATIYSVLEEDEEDTVFEKFIIQYESNYQDEVDNILESLANIGQQFGARKQFFKTEEGKLGDLVCALFDNPDKHLRLYCVRFGATAIIIGGGGPKNTRTWQEDPNLSREAERMIQVSADIYQRIKDREIRWSPDGRELMGDLTFITYE